MNVSHAAAMLTVVHTHFGALLAAAAFLSILPMGTLWRLLGAHAVASNSTFLRQLGGAMLIQY